MPKRRQIRLTAFTLCTTRSTEKMCSCGPGAAAAPTAGALELTGKASKGLKRRGWKGGWNNWRKRCAPGPTGRKRYGGVKSLNLTGSNRRWGNQTKKNEEQRCAQDT